MVQSGLQACKSGPCTILTCGARVLHVRDTYGAGLCTSTVPLYFGKNIKNYFCQKEVSVDLVPTNGKRMVYLDNMSPRGRRASFPCPLRCLWAIWGAIGGLLGPSAGLKRVRTRPSGANGYGKRFGTVSVQVLDVAPRGFPLAEKSLPTAQGTCEWKAQRRFISQ